MAIPIVSEDARYEESEQQGFTSKLEGVNIYLDYCPSCIRQKSCLINERLKSAISRGFIAWEEDFVCLEARLYFLSEIQEKELPEETLSCRLFEPRNRAENIEI